MMSVELAHAPLAPYARVRRAGAADIDVVTRLLAEGYRMAPEITGVVNGLPRDTLGDDDRLAGRAGR